jgi:hypothetical protein
VATISGSFSEGIGIHEVASIQKIGLFAIDEGVGVHYLGVGKPPVYGTEPIRIIELSMLLTSIRASSVT